jgi:hypothetical protein
MPKRRAIAFELMEGLRENLAWFPKYQAHLRVHRPPTLIVWGPQDGYMLSKKWWRWRDRFSRGRIPREEDPSNMAEIAKQPTIARIWRGCVPRERADDCERYNYDVGIKPLIAKALGVQCLREDRGAETEFITISYWENIAAMARFTGGDPTRIHHLPRDSEFLVALPERVQILHLRSTHGNTGGACR